jgi:hypothetical protein
MQKGDRALKERQVPAPGVRFQQTLCRSFRAFPMVLDSWASPGLQPQICLPRGCSGLLSRPREHSANLARMIRECLK